MNLRVPIVFRCCKRRGLTLPQQLESSTSASMTQPSTRRTRLSVAAVALAALASTPSPGQTNVDLAALERCASIAADAARLACYDAVTQVARATPSDAPQQPRSADATTARDSDTGAAATTGIEAFGSEQVDNGELVIPEQIRSRLVGDFTGWRGNTVFRLENGQVWRQSGDGRLVFQADAPLVTIRRGAFGSYRLSVEGINSSVRVRRIE